jgi:hypothetical protein
MVERSVTATSRFPPRARRIVRAGRRGDYFEIKPENMFEMIRPD